MFFRLAAWRERLPWETACARAEVLGRDSISHCSERALTMSQELVVINSWLYLAIQVRDLLSTVLKPEKLQNPTGVFCFVFFCFAF